MATQSENLLFILKAKDEASKTFQKVGLPIKELGAQAAAANQNVKGMGSSFSAARASLGPLLAGMLSFTAVIGIFKSAAAEAEQFAQSQVRLQTVLEATGHQSGLTAKEINVLADEMEKATLFDDAAIRDAASALATFGGIAGDNFKEALSGAADLAAFMRTDISTAAMQLGRALTAPAEGLEALRRSGIVFTAAQKDLIKSLVETGQEAAAQDQILEALQGRIGGMAANEVVGLTGAANSLGDSWDDLMRSIGESVIIDITTASLRLLKDAVDAFNRGNNPTLLDQIADARENLKKAKDAAAGLDSIIDSLTAGTRFNPVLQAQEKLNALLQEQTEILVRDGVQAAAAKQAAIDAARQRADEAKAAADAAKAEAAAKKAAEKAARDAEQAAKDAAKAQMDLIQGSMRIAEEGKKRISDHIAGLRAEEEMVRDLIPTQRLSTDERELATAMLKAQALASSQNRRMTEAEIEAVMDLAQAQKQARDAQLTFGAGLRKVFDDFRNTAKDHASLVEGAFGSLFSGMDHALDEFVETGKLRFKDFARSVIADLAKIASRAALTSILSGIGNALFGGSPTTVAFGAHAHGNAFDHGNVVRMAKGAIVNHPTMFPMARGAGLMGEAGPEAVMPLRRTPSGDLGVIAAGGRGDTVIHNNVTVQVQGQRTANESQNIAAETVRALEDAMRSVIVREQRPGGTLWGTKPWNLS